MLGDRSIEPMFFFGQALVDDVVVGDLLRERSGEFLEWHIMRTMGRPVPLGCPGLHVGIFPNRKSCRGVFDHEVQIIHALSTLLTPQFHTKSTIDFHATSMLDDINSNSLTVCVSEATRTDVLRYLGPLDPARVVTVHNAARLNSGAEAPFAVRKGKPHILIIGTIEPRKNVGQVLTLLKGSPSLADLYDFIFLGRQGWGASIAELVDTYELSALLDRGSLRFPGFVGESEKNALVGSATLVIYPSLLEGFGLPVLEALSQGTPCLTTRSSSMPEVGGDVCFYFDPFEPDGLRSSFIAAQMEIARDAAGLGERCRMQAAAFSWKASYARLMAAIRVRMDRDGRQDKVH